MAKPPANALDKAKRIASAWRTLAASAVFKGKTLAAYDVAIKKVTDSEDRIAAIDRQREAEVGVRDAALIDLNSMSNDVKDGMVGDENFGADSDLYGASGFIRKSERKTGLTRKKKSGNTPAA